MNFKSFILEGNSMSPTLIHDDIIIVKKKKRLSVGDIVVYKIDNKFIAHRVFDIDPKEGIITKADGLRVPDNMGMKRIKKNQIEGVVIAGIRGGKWFTPSSSKLFSLKIKIPIQRLLFFLKQNIFFQKMKPLLKPLYVRFYSIIQIKR